MHALRIIADDLTGACDVAAEMLPWPAGVVVHPAAGAAAPGVLNVRNTQSRTLPPAEAARRVGAALADLRSGWSGIVLKKIDTGLRGPIGAEIDAAMDVLGVTDAFVLPAIPEVGRTTEQGCQLIGGVPVHRTAFARDPQNPIRDASVPAAVGATSRRHAAVIGLGAVRGRDDFDGAVDAARAGGATVFVCDAETDADLERAVRRLLSRPRPLLLVGSTGLARALRRVLGTEHGGRPRGGPTAATGSGVLVVAGSAHPATRAQVESAAARQTLEPLFVDGPGVAEASRVVGRSRWWRRRRRYRTAAPPCWRRSGRPRSPRWRARARPGSRWSAARPPITCSTASGTRRSPSSRASVPSSCGRAS